MANDVENVGASGAKSSTGLVIGIIVALVLVGLFIVYGLPAIQGTPATQSGSTNVNATLPNTGGSTSAPAPSGGATY